MTHQIDIASRPRTERQMIAVYSDAQVDEFRSGKAAPPGTPSNDITLGRIASWTVPAIAIPLELARAYRNAKHEGLEVLAVSDTEIDASGLLFPPSHPRRKVLYVAHPLDPHRYYPLASFHRMVFEDKFAEAIRLLMSLGATRIEVRHERGWSRQFAANAGISLPEGQGKGKFNAKDRAESDSSILFDASFEGGTAAVLPPDLVWYQKEPMWQVIASGRLERKMKAFNLNLEYKENNGVTLALSGKAEGVGLNIGGSFEEHEATIWKISGKFD